jgi:hypothetical protein
MRKAKKSAAQRKNARGIGLTTGPWRDAGFDGKQGNRKDGNNAVAGWYSSAAQ